MDSWMDGPLGSFDLETTGVEPLVDRIVTASFIVEQPNGDVTFARDWLVAVEVDIPEEATGKHHITTEYAREHGDPIDEVIIDIYRVLDKNWECGRPLVVYNAPYDLTMVNAELTRAGFEPMRVSSHHRPVLDPLICDRTLDKYVKGKGQRQLQPTCERYQIPLTDDDAHSSAGDCLASARLMRAIGRRYPRLTAQPLAVLHDLQTQWQATWAREFESYLRRTKRADGATPEEIEAVFIDTSWPVVHSNSPARIGGHR